MINLVLSFGQEQLLAKLLHIHQFLFKTVSYLILFNLTSQYPMYSRDYVYVRRYDVDVDNNLMVLVSRWVLKSGIKYGSVFDTLLNEYLVSVFILYICLLYRAVQHPRVPETQEFVRVHSYQSKMVIRPHKSFDEVCDECFCGTN